MSKTKRTEQNELYIRVRPLSDLAEAWVDNIGFMTRDPGVRLSLFFALLNPI